MRNGKLLALDLFCGAGGFSEGMHLAGWETVLAIECDKAAAETYRHNHGSSTYLLERRIEDVGFSTIEKALDQQGVSPDQIDLVIGGPPCQGFSIIGPRRLDDKRNGLFVEFMRVVELVKPRAFAAENVKGILSFASGVMPHFLDAIAHKMGYRLSFITVNAAHYGVPQQRERVIFMGLRSDEADRLGIEKLDTPKPTAKRVSVGDAISDLPKGLATPSPRAYRVDGQTAGGALGDPMEYPSEAITPYQREMRRNSAFLTGHHTKGMSTQRYERVCSMAEGSTLPSKGRTNAWRRLNSNAYSHALQAHMGKDLKEFIHPTENRWITVREAARLQSFRDMYVFEGAQSSQLRQIGNAVPPLVAKAFGQAIARQLTGHGEIELLSSVSLGHTRMLAAAGKPNLGKCSVTDSAGVLFSKLVSTDPKLRLHVIHEWLAGEGQEST